MKDIIDIILEKEEITILNKYIPKSLDNQAEFDRYMDIVREFIYNTQKVYKKGLSLEKLIELVKFFFEEYNQNVILISYYKHDLNKEEMQMEIKQMIQRYLNKIDSLISLDEEDIESSFSNVSGVEQNKTLSLSNGHPTWTESGFISPILLAILTATIEITSLLYIFLEAME